MNPSAARDAESTGTSEALARAGQDVIDSVDLGPVNELLAGLPTTSLLAELDAVLAAIDSSDAVRSRRRAGVIGRLLGRDLMAQADPNPAEMRVRVHLAQASEHDARLRAHLRRLDDTALDLERDIALLAEAITAARAGLSSLVDASGAIADQASRRLVYLETIAAAWRQCLAQVRLALDHGRRLAARYEQVRDLLVPLWRQHGAARALRGSLHAENAHRLAALHRDAVEALASLHVPSASTPSTLPTAPADRESTP